MSHQRSRPEFFLENVLEKGVAPFTYYSINRDIFLAFFGERPGWDFREVIEHDASSHNTSNALSNKLSHGELNTPITHAIIQPHSITTVQGSQTGELTQPQVENATHPLDEDTIMQDPAQISNLMLHNEA